MGTMIVEAFIYMAAVPNPATIESTTVAEAILNYDAVSYRGTHKSGTAKGTVKVTSGTHTVKRMANMASKREAMDRTGVITGRG